VRRLFFLLAIGLLLAAAVPYLRPAVQRMHFLYTLSTEQAPARLPSPVGIPRPAFVDTWGAARSGGRRHEGIDIFVPRGTPVRSTTRGIVTRVGTNRLGGRIVGVLGPALEWHYYAHLDGFGQFREGDLVREGDVLGYVGDSGNARGTPPHLHYGVYRGGPSNPYSRLAPPESIPHGRYPPPSLSRSYRRHSG
jgi:murein DD-endopeptidase MepM/ murein hydrolase activator NlpD